MLRKLLISTILMTPLVVFAEGNGNAFGHEKDKGNAFGRIEHAPEIDGGNITLGIALLAGIMTLTIRRQKK